MQRLPRPHQTANSSKVRGGHHDPRLDEGKPPNIVKAPSGAVVRLQLSIQRPPQCPLPWARDRDRETEEERRRQDRKPAFPDGWGGHIARLLPGRGSSSLGWSGRVGLSGNIA